MVARLIAPLMASKLGQSVVIDNRPGGGTAIGVKATMTAEPDGYTLMVSNSPTHFIAPLVNKTFTYDPLKDFVPIATVASGGLMLVIAPEVPAKTLQEFVAHAKANPGKLNFGFGQGTLPQLVGEMFKLASGTDIANIPYKGGIQAVTDMLGGRVQMNIGTISTLAPLVREGKLRALAITSADTQCRTAGRADHGGGRAAGGRFGDHLRLVRTGRHSGERGRAAQRLGQRKPEIGGAARGDPADRLRAAGRGAGGFFKAARE